MRPELTPTSPNELLINFEGSVSFLLPFHRSTHWSIVGTLEIKTNDEQYCLLIIICFYFKIPHNWSVRRAVERQQEWNWSLKIDQKIIWTRKCRFRPHDLHTQLHLEVFFSLPVWEEPSLHKVHAQTFPILLQQCDIPEMGAHQ